MMSLWDALRMNMMISYQELVRTFLSKAEKARQINSDEPYIEIICMDSKAEIQKAD
ncbi:hypothetical protein H0P27_17845 [Escherichia coli]|nr:hypothetical protein [Escherichia coli]